MAKDYRYERGLVGKWNGVNVIIVDKDEDIKLDGSIYVAAHEGMKMIKDNIVIGVLNPNGNVNQFDKAKHYTYNKPKPQVFYKEKEKIPVPVAAEEALKDVVLQTTIPQGYFDQFTFNVDNFFATLGKE